MPLILFFLCISSGSVYAAARWERKYEEVLPLTCCTMVLTMFLFGVFGFLKLGAAVVCAACAGLYVLTALRVGKQKTGRVLLQNVFTPGFALFLAFNLMYIVCIYGKLFDCDDEFSHWGDTVRILCNLDVFGTHPAANALYPSYPPAMSLFQYFLQKLKHWQPGHPLVEWMCYYAYRVFALSLIMPMCTRIRRDWLGYGLFALGVFCLPGLFYDHYYDNILIDPFVGIASGAGICLVVWEQRKDFLYHARVLTICAVLVLAKDAGALFAVILAAMYALEQWQSEKKLRPAVLAAAAVAVPKLLWSFNIWSMQAQRIFSEKVDFSQFLNIILGRDTTYRQDIWYLFLRNLVSARTQIISLRTYFRLFLSPLAVMVLLVAAVWWIARSCAKKGDIARSTVPLVTGMVSVQMIGFTVGICAMYLFKFTEYEAYGLECFDRYYGMLFQSGWTVVLMGLMVLLKDCRPVQAVAAGLVLAGFLVAASPVTLMYEYLTGYTVRSSQSYRRTFEPLTQAILHNAGTDDHICVVGVDHSGMSAGVMRYCVQLPNVDCFSIADNIPMLTPEEWSQLLWKDYDYVALYRFNDDFQRDYGYLFENPQDLQPDTLYRVDPQQKTLVLCQ